MLDRALTITRFLLIAVTVPSMLLVGYGLAFDTTPPGAPLLIVPCIALGILYMGLQSLSERRNPR